MGHIIVRFITTDAVVSRVIRYWTNSCWSHVEFGTAKGTWIGAHLQGGIQERVADYCKPTREHVYAIPCTDAEQQQWEAEMRADIGTPYNVLDIIGLLIHKRKLTSPNRDICSEWCTAKLLKWFGPQKVLNCESKPEYEALITPEILHLSPIFAGRLISAVN